AIVPDPDLARDIQTWIGAPTRGSPARSAWAARLALGELATIYLETPGTPRRGAAVLFPERAVADPGFLVAFARLVRASPWLQPMAPSRLARAIPTSRPGVRLTPRSGPGFPAGYADRFGDARDALARFHSSVRGAQIVGDRLSTDLLLAIGGTAVRDVPVGEEFLSHVTGTVRQAFQGLRPPPSGTMVTLPSLRGTVVFRVINNARYAMKTVVRLIPHGQLTLPTGDRTTVLLQPGESRLVSMTVQAQTTGRFPITVQILAPQ